MISIWFRLILFYQKNLFLKKFEVFIKPEINVRCFPFPQFALITAKIQSDRQTSVAAWLQLNILLGREQTVYPQDVRAGQTQRCGLDPSLLPFLYFCLLFLEPDWFCPMAYTPIDQERGIFFPPEVPTLVLGFSSLVSFCGLSNCHFALLFFLF